MSEFVQPADLTPFASIDPVKAAAMIEDAEAMASLVAPCLAQPADLTAGQRAAVKAILRGAILRWHDAGSGAVQSQTAGPFSQSLDTRQTRRSMFWPSEIEQLQELCGGKGNEGAFSIDTVSAAGPVHADVCALNFGAQYCSCGAVLTQGLPLYETGGW